MGLTSFSGDFPTAKDIGIAKNYLTEEELRVLNGIGRTGRRILFGLLGSIMVLVSVLRLKNKKK